MLKKLCIAVLALLAVSTICFADANKPIWISAGGYDVLKIRTGSAGNSLEKRAGIIQDRMNTFIGMKTKAGKSPKVYLVHTSRHSIAIMSEGLKIVEVQERDADATNMTLKDLADQWKKSMETIHPLATPIKIPGNKGTL